MIFVIIAVFAVIALFTAAIAIKSLIIISVSYTHLTLPTTPYV